MDLSTAMRNDYSIQKSGRVLKGQVWIANVVPAWGRRWRSATVDGRWIGEHETRTQAFLACVHDHERPRG